MLESQENTPQDLGCVLKHFKTQMLQLKKKEVKFYFLKNMHCGHIQKDLQPLIRFYCLFLILVTVFVFVCFFTKTATPTNIWEIMETKSLTTNYIII